MNAPMGPQEIAAMLRVEGGSVIAVESCGEFHGWTCRTCGKEGEVSESLARVMVRAKAHGAAHLRRRAAS